MDAAPSAKQPRLDDGICIICSSKAPIKELVKPRDEESKQTLYNAATIRNFSPILNIDIDHVDKLLYHRNCRAIFTMKKSLDHLSQPEPASVSGSEVQRRSSRESPSTPNESDSVCIFCEKKDKYRSGSRTQEPLVKSLELRSDEKVRTAATKKA